MRNANPKKPSSSDANENAPSYEFVDDNDEGENLNLTPQDITSTVVSTTDWTTETLIAQLVRKNIDISPRFQRRDAWTRARKSKYVESLILNLPVPQIVLAEKKDQRGQFIVLDGKQRLLTLLQFADKAEGKNNGFKLSGLELRDDLNTKTYSDLVSDIFRRDDLNAFHNSSVRSVVIRNWPNEKLLHTIFLRLNTGSVSLSPQELRQALFPGPFVDYVDDLSTQSQSLRRLLGLTEPDFRMRDVEIMVRYVGFAMLLNKYSGSMQGFLDLTCSTLNRQWSVKNPEIKGRFEEFERALQASFEIFGDKGIARKWTGQVFESRPNKAVLDVLLFYFADDKLRQEALKKKKAVIQEYKELCVGNDEFRKSIESTTKSLTATYSRLRIWGEVLERILQLPLSLPVWIQNENRIGVKAEQ